MYALGKIHCAVYLKPVGFTVCDMYFSQKLGKTLEWFGFFLHVLCTSATLHPPGYVATICLLYYL